MIHFQHIQRMQEFRFSHRQLMDSCVICNVVHSKATEASDEHVAIILPSAAEPNMKQALKTCYWYDPAKYHLIFNETTMFNIPRNFAS
jgi:hypothetical protein